MSMKIGQTNRAPAALAELMSSDLMAGGGTEMVVAEAAAQLDDVRQRSRAASRESRSAQRDAQREKLAHERKGAALKLAGALVNSAASATMAVVSLSSHAGASSDSTSQTGEANAADGATQNTSPPADQVDPQVDQGADASAAPTPSGGQTGQTRRPGWSSLVQPTAKLTGAILGHYESKQDRAAEASGFAAEASRDAAQQEAESAQAADQAVTRALNHADQIAELMHRARMAEISA